MHTQDLADANIEKIGQLFPNCLTERINENGKPEMAIDFDKLKQELSKEIVEGNQERYQFTWPGKREAMRLANTPSNMTLRPDRESSVDFDNTENLYIEGDNLEVLKLLREDYLGKVKMIYIDPPYNTGNDFVYEDDFSETAGEFKDKSGMFDKNGNMILDKYSVNSESNGRFHTDWLNMMYPRLHVAKDILSSDGCIFISIDDNEVENLKKVCDEIFGELNFVATFPWRKRTAKSDVPFGVSQDYEWVVCYAKSSDFAASIEGKERKYYTTPDFPDRPWRVHDLTKQTTASERPNSFFTIVNPKNGKEYPANPNATWRITVDTLPEYIASNRIVFPGDYGFLGISKPVLRYWKEDDIKKAGESFGRVAVSTKFDDSIGMSQDGTKEITTLFNGKVFSFPKPTSLIKFLISIVNDSECTILDFFSGSATTAHSILRLNSEDQGYRKFILVQLPELSDIKSEAYKAGYKTICEIGKERIRRAGKKIKEENPLTTQNLDTGFRVLKLDTSNMQDVYYKPEEFTEKSLFEDNVKPDRTSEDLLFQVMLECNLPLSAKIERKTIAGKDVFNVNEGYLLACFDEDVNETVITEVAKLKPYYFIMRDKSLSSDNVADNFEQIFNAYSKDTIRRIL